MKIIKLTERVKDFLNGDDELISVVAKDLNELGNSFSSSDYEVTCDGNFMYIKHNNEFEVQFYFEEDILKSKLYTKDNYNAKNYNKIFVITNVVIKISKYFNNLEKEFEQYRKLRNFGRNAENNLSSAMVDFVRELGEFF